MKKRRLVVFAAFALALSPAAAWAWGDEGHEITGLIAYDHLTSAAKAKVDALLASDKDTLTSSDFPSRATWADKYRNAHRETAAWHFVDLEIESPDLRSACFNSPTLAQGQAASTGPANDCVIDKIQQFETELHDPSTPAAEQLLALKFLMHFVGDIHQPLHASDHNDRDGNCIEIAPILGVRSTNLHAYWDTGVMQALGASAPDIAARLNGQIKPAQVAAWSMGGAEAWAAESYAVAKSVAYQLPSRPTCGAHGTVALSAAYQASIQTAVVTQLQKAGIRMAYVLNGALGR